VGHWATRIGEVFLPRCNRGHLGRQGLYMSSRGVGFIVSDWFWL